MHSEIRDVVKEKDGVYSHVFTAYKKAQKAGYTGDLNSVQVIRIDSKGKRIAEGKYNSNTLRKVGSNKKAYIHAGDEVRHYILGEKLTVVFVSRVDRSVTPTVAPLAKRKKETQFETITVQSDPETETEKNSHEPPFSHSEQTTTETIDYLNILVNYDPKKDKKTPKVAESIIKYQKSLKVLGLFHAKPYPNIGSVTQKATLDAKKVFGLPRTNKITVELTQAIEQEMFKLLLKENLSEISEKTQQASHAEIAQLPQRLRQSVLPVPSIEMPIQGKYKRKSKYGKRTHPISRKRGKMHNGVDYAPRNKEGWNVYPTIPDGTIMYAGKAGGHGNRIVISHENEVGSAYSHLSKIYVKKGDVIKDGRIWRNGRDITYKSKNGRPQIGKIGATGYVTGPHLHFEMLNGMKFDRTGQIISKKYVDPEKARKATIKLAQIRKERRIIMASLFPKMGIPKPSPRNRTLAVAVNKKMQDTNRPLEKPRLFASNAVQGVLNDAVFDISPVLFLHKEIINPIEQNKFPSIETPKPIEQPITVRPANKSETVLTALSAPPKPRIKKSPPPTNKPSKVVMKNIGTNKKVEKSSGIVGWISQKVNVFNQKLDSDEVKNSVQAVTEKREKWIKRLKDMWSSFTDNKPEKLANLNQAPSNFNDPNTHSIHEFVDYTTAKGKTSKVEVLGTSADGGLRFRKKLAKRYIEFAISAKGMHRVGPGKNHLKSQQPLISSIWKKLNKNA